VNNMSTQKLIAGIILPLIVVLTYGFMFYTSWVGLNAQMEHAATFCSRTPEYVNMFGIEQCNRFTENNITQFNAMKMLSVTQTGLALLLSFFLSVLAFRQGGDTSFDKQAKRLLLAAFTTFALLFLVALINTLPLLTTIPLVIVPIVFGVVLISVLITWGYAAYYFINSVIEKNVYKIILALVMGALVSFPIMELLSATLFRK